MRRLRRIGGPVLVVVMTTGALLLATAGAAPSDACRDATVKSGKTGTWTLLEPPTFPAGEQQVLAHAVDPARPDDWFVTNGLVIMASHDGGCGWETTYELGSQPALEQPLDEQLGRIRQLSARGGRVLATVTGPQAPLPVPPVGEEPFPPNALTVVLHSGDGGREWAASDPMPNGGAEAGPVVQAPSRPEVAYLATGRQIRRSDDGGATWSVRGPALESDPGSNATAPIEHIAVDPRDPQRLIARGKHTAWRSADGGATFTAYAGEQEPAGTTLFGPGFGSGGRVVFAHGDDDAGVQDVDLFHVSKDRGESWATLEPHNFGIVCGVPASIATGPEADDLVMTTAPGFGRAGIYRWLPATGKLGNVDEFRVAPLWGATIEDGGGERAYFFASRRLVVWRPPPGGMGEVPEPPGSCGYIPPPAYGDGDEPPQPEDKVVGPAATLSPAGGDIRVEPGGSTEVEYALHMPKRPARLDGYFLLDTSGSTDPYIESLGKGLDALSQGVAGAGVDGWFGLGEYQDVNGIRYRRRLDVRPPDEHLHNKLKSIVTGGGGGGEPGYTALHQAATGTGIENPRKGTAVPPDKGVHWRRNAVRVILHAADEPLATDEDGATRDQAVAALTERQIRSVGLLVSEVPVPAPSGSVNCDAVEVVAGQIEGTATDPSANAKLRCQLEDVARATGAIAPPGGVDCDGNGIVDVPEGQPMVCVVSDTTVVDISKISDAVLRLVMSFPVKESLSLRGGQSAAQIAVTPKGDYTGVDPRVGADAAFTVSFSCTKEQVGKVLDAPIEALANDLPIAAVAPRVVCGDAPLAVVPPVPPGKSPPEEPLPAQPRPEPAVVPAAAPAPAPAQSFAPAVPPTQMQSVAPLPAPPPPPAQVPSTAPAQAQAPSTVTGSVSAAVDQHQEAVAFQTVRVEDEGPEAAELHFALRTVGFAGVLVFAGAAVRRRQKKSIPRRVHVR